MTAACHTVDGYDPAPPAPHENIRLRGIGVTKQHELVWPSRSQCRETRTELPRSEFQTVPEGLQKVVSHPGPELPVKSVCVNQVCIRDLSSEAFLTANPTQCSDQSHAIRYIYDFVYVVVCDMHGAEPDFFQNNASDRGCSTILLLYTGCDSAGPVSTLVPPSWWPQKGTIIELPRR
jgi:hypothetical protein